MTRQSWDAIKWWEIRRIIFNVVVLICGLISLGVYLEIGGHFVQLGEDVVEPLIVIFGIVVFALAANVAYTMGWVTELLWGGGDTSRTKDRRFKVFILGMILSCLVTLAPAVLFPLAWMIIGFK